MRFFKVMMPGFQDSLTLPPAFCADKLQVDVAESCRSAMASVTTSRGKWEIKMHKNSKGLISFKEGWPDFVHNHSLVLGNFVVFEHIGNLHFNAFIFDESTTCEKMFLEEEPIIDHQLMQGKSSLINANETTKGTILHDSGRKPHFIATIHPSNARPHARLNIPVEFLRSNDLCKKRSISLRDPCGKIWPISLRISKRYENSFRGLMTQGWSDFYKSNKLEDGDICLFELDPHSSGNRSDTIEMDVQIFPAPAVCEGAVRVVV